MSSSNSFLDGLKPVGFIAEDVPDLVARKGRRGLSSMDIVAVLTRVVQAQQKTIGALSEKLAGLERATGLRRVVSNSK